MPRRPAKKKTTSKTSEPKKTVRKGNGRPTTKTSAKKPTRTKATTKRKKPTKTTTRPKAKTTNRKPTKRKTNKTQEPKYIRVSENASHARFVEMGKKVQNHEVRWVRYEADGRIGYHYYKILK